MTWNIASYTVSEIWASTLRGTLEDPCIHSDAVVILKLLVFSLHVFEVHILSGLSRLASADYQSGWAPLFCTFGRYIQQLSLQELQRRGVGVLATACLETLRYQEIQAVLSRAADPLPPYYRSTRRVSRRISHIHIADITNWSEDRRSFPSTVISIFPLVLIEALDPIVQPRWAGQIRPTIKGLVFTAWVEGERYASAYAERMNELSSTLKLQV